MVSNPWIRPGYFWGNHSNFFGEMDKENGQKWCKPKVLICLLPHNQFTRLAKPTPDTINSRKRGGFWEKIFHAPSSWTTDKYTEPIVKLRSRNFGVSGALSSNGNARLLLQEPCLHTDPKCQNITFDLRMCSTWWRPWWAPDTGHIQATTPSTASSCQKDVQLRPTWCRSRSQRSLRAKSSLTLLSPVRERERKRHLRPSCSSLWCPSGRAML